jgi:hypothetical protein
MKPVSQQDCYLGLFRWEPVQGGGGRIVSSSPSPRSVPDPQTGRPLRVSTLEGNTRAICPLCSSLGDGGFVSFEADFRIAYACPICRGLIWSQGA